MKLRRKRCPEPGTVLMLGSHAVTGLSVSRHEVIEVVGSVGFSLEASAGQVWLTHDRALHDDVLVAGQRIGLPADRRVFLSGLPTATVNLIPRTCRAKHERDPIVV